MASIAPELLSEERLSLIKKMSELTVVSHVDSITWAMLWLADLEVLRGDVHNLEAGPKRWVEIIRANFRQPLNCRKSLKAWLAHSQREPNDNDSPAPYEAPASATVVPPISSRKRKAGKQGGSPTKIPRPTTLPPPVQVPWSKPARDTANCRDKGLCVITKVGEPNEICHIFPYSLGSKTDEEKWDFWGLMKMFWSSEKIEKWQAGISVEEGTEVPQNLLCLCCLPHKLWGLARFALEPIEMSEDKMSLKVRFWWLPRRQYNPRMQMCERPSLPSDMKSSDNKCKLLDCETDIIIYSGHTITMTTQDPETMPLPSFDLLHMQWVLNRVAAMSGAADAPDEDPENDFL